MVKSETGVIWCDGFGMEINWGPLVIPGKDPRKKSHYCCRDCSQGIHCRCRERMEIGEYRQ